MQEFDLNHLWEDSEKEASVFYQSIQDDILDMARKRSKSALHKVKRIGYWEFVVGGLMFAGFLFVFRNSSISILIPLLVLTGLAFGVSFRIFRTMVKKIDSVHIQNTKAAIEQYIEILRNYRRKVETYIVVFTPLGFAIGFYSGYSREGGGWQDLLSLKLLFVLALSSLLLYGLIAVTKNKYLNWSIGRQIEELESILNHLKTSE